MQRESLLSELREAAPLLSVAAFMMDAVRKAASEPRRNDHEKEA